MYEGMFLVDSAKAGSDWEGLIAAITKILERAEAEIVSIRKWEDRRLAYEIKHVGRGTYILAYFRADGQNIQGIEKAVQLSEQIMRVLILSAEHMTAEDMEKDTPATKVEKEATTSEPSEKMDEKDQAGSPDDLQEVPITEVTEETEAVEDVGMKVEEVGIKEDAEIAEESEEAGDVEPSEEEEELKPKTELDD
jgi:small subunit ribosomal protein S6